MTGTSRRPLDRLRTDVPATPALRRVDEVRTGVAAEMRGLSSLDEARAASMADEGGVSAPAPEAMERGGRR